VAGNHGKAGRATVGFIELGVVGHL
jgi:hypothetical protein